MALSIFFTNYHNQVNRCFVEDFVSLGHTVYLPRDNWGRIGFYAPNNEHADIAKLVTYEEYRRLPVGLIHVIPCNQLIEPFMNLWHDRLGVDPVVYLTAQSISSFPDDGTDFVMTHDIDYHRRSPAPFKMIYFSRPRLYFPQTKDLRKAYDARIIRLYTHNFRGPGFEPEYADAKRFRDLWLASGGKGGEFFGYGNENGELSEQDVQKHMLDSMFTLVFKRRETWGQMTNVSMLLGTPLVMHTSYINNLLKYYEVTCDNTIIGDTVEELVDQINSLSFEQYETLSWQARTMAEMFCADGPRRTHLSWFLSKIKERYNLND